MPEQHIYILTGEIHSGKTTSIRYWKEGRSDVFGILSPDINGERYFVDIHTNDEFKMQNSFDEFGLLPVGKYRFSKRAFEKASAIIRDALKRNEGWIVIDEIGPLELRRQGFHDVVKEVIAESKQMKKLFVVRRSLVEEVIRFFEIGDHTIITAPIAF